MKKTIQIILILLSLTATAQSVEIDPNFWGTKVQLYGGGIPDVGIITPGGFSNYLWGLEFSEKANTFGFNISNGLGILAQNKYSPIYSYNKHLSYYGYRISTKHFSTSINVGVGSLSLNRSSYYYNNDHATCLEFFLKTNITKRGNGLGLILSANINRLQTIFEARLVFQLGYEWNKMKKPSTIN